MLPWVCMDLRRDIDYKTVGYITLFYILYYHSDLP